jgi:isopentenyl diphosphate isomerase/L-lactate dehydrogenase-like FMN-dependent dehydrogenase
MADRVNSPRVLNIADLRLLAKRRLPRVAFDYIDGGADGEVTLRENCRIFDDVMFRPRCAVSAPADLRTKVLGHDLALPFVLAPVGDVEDARGIDSVSHGSGVRTADCTTISS